MASRWQLLSLIDLSLDVYIIFLVSVHTLQHGPSSHKACSLSWCPCKGAVLSVLSDPAANSIGYTLHGLILLMLRGVHAMVCGVTVRTTTHLLCIFSSTGTGTTFGGFPRSQTWRISCQLFPRFLLIRGEVPATSKYSRTSYCYVFHLFECLFDKQ